VRPETRAKRPPLAPVEGQLSTRRQGVARLIASAAAGLIDQQEFEPRLPRRRQRLARVEEQRQALADEAAVAGALQRIIGRLEDCAAKRQDGLAATDWASKRDLLRALVKRVEVARNEVNVVVRIDPYPGDGDPEKKSWQLCRGRADAALGRPVFRSDSLVNPHRREVCPLSRQVMLPACQAQPVSVPLLDGVRFFPPLSLHRRRSASRLSSRSRARSDMGLPRSARLTRTGEVLSVRRERWVSMTGSVAHPVPTTGPCGSSLSASLACHFSRRLSSVHLRSPSHPSSPISA